MQLINVVQIKKRKKAIDEEINVESEVNNDQSVSPIFISP